VSQAGRWRSAAQGSFWLDDPARPAPRPALSAATTVDTVVVGGGFTGLWAALAALEADPGSSVLLLEASRIAEHASGRNGGFCSASLTHGDANGRSRWPDEMPLLRRLGTENLSGLVADVARLGIDCDLEETGELTLAVAPWQMAELREESRALTAAGVAHRLVEAEGIDDLVRSPLATGGLLEEHGTVLVNPARLAWGLAAGFEERGGVLAEHTTVERLSSEGGRLRLRTPAGIVTASRAIVATSAFRPLVRRTAGRTVPVYDYVLMTEPLSPAQRASIGWAGRQGIGDAGNQFHYLRLTADDRLLFGGYDAVYRFAQRVDPRHDQDPATFAHLEADLAAMFPELADVAFSHRWGGAIDTSTRFCAAATTSHGGRVVTINGFTGLGVGASRFFARTGIDLLAGQRTEATECAMVRRAPVPFPPEPIRWAGIQATRRAIAAADAHEGRRGPWLRVLDRLGLGFDS